MKILITGISGMLGLNLWEELSRDPQYELFGLDLNKPAFMPKENWINCDITEFKDTYQKITKLNPEIIIHTAAITDVDACEKDPELAFKINSLGTRNIAVAAQKFDSTLIYISTDYVFDGKTPPKSGYKEMDKVNPASVYGTSKLWGEYFVSKLLNKFYIVRTSWLFGKCRDNFVSSASGADNVIAADDIISSPTYAKDLSEALKLLIDHHLSVGSGPFGIYHLTNGGFASRYEIAQYVRQLLNAPESNIKKIKLKDLNLAALRPQFSAMENLSWRLCGFKPLRPWQEAVADYLEEIGKI